MAGNVPLYLLRIAVLYVILNSYIIQNKNNYMQKQEILNEFKKKLKIENYSDQTIRNYVSTISLFLNYFENLHLKEITDKEISDYLYYCKTEKNYSFSSMKQVISSIRYLLQKGPQ